MNNGMDGLVQYIPDESFAIPRGGYTLSDSQSRHISFPAIIGAFIAIAVISNRLYWRLRLTYTLSLDDYLIFLAMISLVAFSGCFLAAVGHGYGHPSNQINPSDLRIAVMMIYLTQILYLSTVYLTKLSILGLYLRIFKAKWSTRTCKIIFVIIALYAVAAILSTMFQCWPINSIWDLYVFLTFYRNRDAHGYEIPELGDWTCTDRSASWLVSAVFNTTSDFIILALLPFMIWTLQFSRAKKIGLTAIFGVGVFAFAAGILRLTTLVEATQNTALDPMVDTVPSSMWTIVEASLGAICACLPMLRTALQQFFPRCFDRVFRTPNPSQHSTIPLTEIAPLPIQIVKRDVTQASVAAQRERRRSGSLGGLLETVEGGQGQSPTQTRAVRRRTPTFNYAQYQGKGKTDRDCTPGALPQSPSFESF